MKRFAVLFLTLVCSAAFAVEPFRVLISGDDSESGKTFAADVFAALKERGATATVAAPDTAHLAAADVLVLFGSEMKALPETERAPIEAFAKRGGGIVALHGATAAPWMRPLLGGSWVDGKSSEFRSKMMVYVATDQHPIVAGASPFDLDDETLYDLDLDPKITVLASAFTPKVTGLRGDQLERRQRQAKADRANVYDLQPQIWAFEGEDAHRAVVLLPGAPETLKHASIRTFIQRGIAWAGHRDDLDELSSPADLASLRYPAAGPERAEDTVKQFEIAPGFRASVAAAEPLINKPIAVQWDAAGRLWVAETPEYPNGRRPLVTEPWKETGTLEPGKYDRPAEDRISILSDPDASGRFTKKRVFFQGLELVTGFCIYRDGVIALAQPDIVFIHGEGAGQKVERLFTGFTPGDTHFVGNHLIVAADGWVYASMGGGAEVKKPDGKEVIARISSGMFRFRPDGSAIEQVSSKGGNGFGADVTSDGELFFGQATSGNPVQHVALPESTLELGKVGTQGGAQSVIAGRKVVVPHMPDRMPLMQIDQVGGYSSACASLVYEGGAWPAEFAGSIFCTEPILNIVHHEILHASGATFTGEMVRKDAEFIHSPDYWFRPIDVSCGPDGALYILDLYNPVIAHSDSRGPQHSRSGASVRPDREHYFGRIYRVQHEQAQRLPVPDLSHASAVDLAKALSHPNRTVRSNALRVLMEKSPAEIAPVLTPIAETSTFTPARILALWGLQRVGALSSAQMKVALHDTDPAIRKTAALIAEAASADAVQSDLAAGLSDPDPRARIAMLRGLAACKLTPAAAVALIAIFPQLTDDLTKSAAVAAAASSPGAVIEAAFDAANPDALAQLVGNIAAVVVEKQDADTFARLISAMPAKPAAADPLKRIVLVAAATVKAQPATAVSASVLRALLTSPDETLRTSALPLAATWDKSGALQPDVQTAIAPLLAQLADPKLPDDRRAQLATSLIGARAASPDILPAIRKLLNDPDASEPLKRTVIAALGATGDPAVGPLLVGAFDALPALVQPAAFDILLSRVEWTTAFLDAIEGQKVQIAALGPANLFRLRTHPQRALAQRATALLDTLRKTNTDKDAVIAQLTPLVTRPGNAEHGRELFTQTCAICHRLGDLGKDIGPVLTGIGAHGPEQLLVTIVDPNRQIDAGFELYNVETRDGTLQAGILAQENDARIVLRSQAGDIEVPKANIKSSVNTHRSLMPEGFEALGPDSLRDLLTFLCGSETRYRVLDLSRAFTADTRRGLYQSQEAVGDTFVFTKFGVSVVAGIPFDIVNPAQSLLGGNIIVLRGGGRESFAHTLPQRVEVKVGLPVRAFAFLGGVAGWGSRKADPDGKAIMKVTSVFADGESESVTLHNGIEFADYAGTTEVPGSQPADSITREKQMRWFTIPLKKRGVVEKLILESLDNGPAATTVAITADLGEPAH